MCNHRIEIDAICFCPNVRFADGVTMAGVDTIVSDGA